VRKVLYRIVIRILEWLDGINEEFPGLSMRYVRWCASRPSYWRGWWLLTGMMFVLVPVYALELVFNAGRQTARR
jgi:hypothetical protein